MLQPLLLLLGMVLVIALVGKAFCAWMCPAPWLKRLFKPGKRKAADGSVSAAHHACSTLAIDGHRCASCALAPVGGGRDGLRLDTRHATLLGALGASAVFGFPVFCLVCPIGLTFATFIGVWHLFQFNETSWGLIIFPAILVLEIAFLRKWCAKIMPCERTRVPDLGLESHPAAARARRRMPAQLGRGLPRLRGSLPRASGSPQQAYPRMLEMRCLRGSLPRPSYPYEAAPVGGGTSLPRLMRARSARRSREAPACCARRACGICSADA